MIQQTTALSLTQLVKALEAHAAELVGSDLQVTGIAQDSRVVATGDLFAVRQGSKQPGASFIEAARHSGAAALLVAKGSPAEDIAKTLGMPFIRVRDVDAALGPAAQVLAGCPTDELAVVGVTGTNGKTTTVTLVRQALAATGQVAAELGTLGFRCGDVHTSTGLTTPGAELIARDMRTALNYGAGSFLMEVSSHAVVQRRIDGIRFRVVAFSNLTRDHLDFHGTLAEYAAAKFRLFTDYPAQQRVINVDDAYGAEFAAALENTGRPLIRVSRKGSGDVSLKSAVRRGRETLLTVNIQGEVVALPTELVGEHNIDNLLLAVGILVSLGVSVRQLSEISLAMTGAPGRLERCDTSADNVTVLVDYAHTPDALERVLGACRGLTRGRVLLVFGCGGDRDPGKRSVMGRIAGANSERCWVTNDNPRSEDPGVIAEAIAQGVRSANGRYEVCLDRAQAIEAAVLEAVAGDVVLVAGKGHEDYQLVGNQRLSFDDRVASRSALELRRGRAALEGSPA